MPSYLTNLTSLSVISLVSCNLYGDLPSSVFQIPNLEVLVLTSNRKLTGHLPDFQLGGLPLRLLEHSILLPQLYQESCHIQLAT